ncbi:MAG: tetraacyldisaccharide 4'-kinase [Candidatus Zixiibacteriota bacterium]
MQKIWLKIIGHKGNLLFWPILALLWIASVFYRLGANLKRHFSKAEIKTRARVFSIGNLTVGGTGKTPMVITLGKYFISTGKKVGIVSSGYGRKHALDIIGSGQELATKSADDLGDEAMVMIHALPQAYFSISKSKSNAAHMLDMRYDLDIILVDDGYQHRRLHRDFDILLLDAGHDLRKDSLFPFGTLREPAAGIGRADAVIFTKTNFHAVQPDYREWIRQIYHGEIIAEVNYCNDHVKMNDEKIPMENLADKKIYFFAGIGGFGPLLEHLKKRFNNISGYRQFPDHCSYLPSDTARIKKDLDKLIPEIVITTNKDFVKLSGFDFGLPIYYLDLKLKFAQGEQELRIALEDVVKE